MRSEQLLVVLLAAVAAGRPVPAPRDADLVPRELQYADIAAAYALRAPGPHDGAKVRRELQYTDIVALSGRLSPASHAVDHANVHRELEYAQIVTLGGAPRGRHHGSPEHHHAAGEGHVHFASALVSLLREARLDVSARVLEGIRTFLSNADRDAPEHTAEHPHDSVVSNILEFFSRATK